MTTPSIKKQLNLQEMYSRQTILPEIGIEGQNKIQNSKITIIGCGALGTVAAELLIRSGVQNLTIIDRDIIELSNLQRQSLYTLEDVGKTKSTSLKNKLLQINPNINIMSKIIHLNHKNIRELNNSNLILDCTDNIKTRLLINDYAKNRNISWIYSAAIKYNGMIMPIFPDQGPCLQCFLPPKPETETCSTAGVLNTTTHIIASMQTTIALKIILEEQKSKQELSGILQTYNSWNNEIQKIKIKQNDDCQACKNNYIYLNNQSEQQTEKFCSSRNYQILGEKDINLKMLKEKLEHNHHQNTTITYNKISLIVSEDKNNHLILFSDGRALIKTKTLEQAESMYSKYVGN